MQNKGPESAFDPMKPPQELADPMKPPQSGEVDEVVEVTSVEVDILAQDPMKPPQ